MNNALRSQEPPSELELQSEAQRVLAPQSEANVCRHKCNLKNLAYSLHRTPDINWAQLARLQHDASTILASDVEFNLSTRTAVAENKTQK